MTRCTVDSVSGGRKARLLRKELLALQFSGTYKALAQADAQSPRADLPKSGAQRQNAEVTLVTSGLYWLPSLACAIRAAIAMSGFGEHLRGAGEDRQSEAAQSHEKC